MKTVFGLLGAVIVGLCVGMSSMVFCPYLNKFVPVQVQCPVVKKCKCEKCVCCPACTTGEKCKCENCSCCKNCNKKSCCPK